nr:MAG TPA: hypothetical protein [Caudoviricetes sp.]
MDVLDIIKEAAEKLNDEDTLTAFQTLAHRIWELETEMSLLKPAFDKADAELKLYRDRYGYITVGEEGKTA